MKRVIIAVFVFMLLAGCLKEDIGDISISVFEPTVNTSEVRKIEASVFSTNRDNGPKPDILEYTIDPGAGFEVMYKISNISTEDRILELIPRINGELQGAFESTIMPYNKEAEYPFLENIQGPAHLLAIKGGGYFITIRVIFENAQISPTSISLHINGTDCIDIESCPWG